MELGGEPVAAALPSRGASCLSVPLPPASAAVANVAAAKEAAVALLVMLQPSPGLLGSGPAACCWLLLLLLVASASANCLAFLGEPVTLLQPAAARGTGGCGSCAARFSGLALFACGTCCWLSSCRT